MVALKEDFSKENTFHLTRKWGNQVCLKIGSFIEAFDWYGEKGGKDSKEKNNKITGGLLSRSRLL